MRPQLLLRSLFIAAAVMLIVLIQVVKSIDLQRYQSAVSLWGQHQTGRELRFAGPLRLKLSLRPALVADDVTLADKAGSARAEMLHLGHVEAEIGLFPLLIGELRLARLRIEGASLTLAADGDGHGNWELTPMAASPDQDGDIIAALRLSQITLDYVDVTVQDGDSHRLSIDHAVLDSDGPAAPLALTLDGQWDQRHVAVNGIIGSLKELFEGGKPYPVNLKLLLPGMIASVNGAIKGEPNGLNAMLAMALEVKDVNDLDRFLGIPLPSLGSGRAALTLSGPLERPHITAIDATIGRHDTLAIAFKGAIDDPVGGNGVDLALTVDGDLAPTLGATGQAGAVPLALSGHVSSNRSGAERGWHIADLKGSLGRSDLVGQLSIARHNGHAVIEGRFESAQIDMSRPMEKVAEPVRASGDGHLFPDTRLPLDLLQDNEGHLGWHIGRLRDRRVDVANIALDLQWREGATLATFMVGDVAGGHAEGRFSLEPGKPAQVNLELAVSRLSAGELLAQLGLSDAFSPGRLDLRVKAAATGDTPRAIFASLRGESLLALEPTQISNRLAGDGLGAVLTYLSPNLAAPASDLRCLLSQFTLADGLARSEALLFALGPIVVSGQGSVNLGDEGLDFTLTPRPVGPIAAASLEIAGTLNHPLVTPNKGAIVKHSPALVTAADSPLLTLGRNDGNACFAALSQARKTRGAGGAPK